MRSKEMAIEDTAAIITERIEEVEIADDIEIIFNDDSLSSGKIEHLTKIYLGYSVDFEIVVDDHGRIFTIVSMLDGNLSVKLNFVDSIKTWMEKTFWQDEIEWNSINDHITGGQVAFFAFVAGRIFADSKFLESQIVEEFCHSVSVSLYDN